MQNKKTIQESKNHFKRKQNWKQKLENQGFNCELEKIIFHPKNPDQWVQVDVYAENESKIICIEVIETHWSKKDPRDYLQTNKEIVFIKDDKEKRKFIDIRIPIFVRDQLRNLKRELEAKNTRNITYSETLEVLLKRSKILKKIRQTGKIPQKDPILRNQLRRIEF